VAPRNEPTLRRDGAGGFDLLLLLGLVLVVNLPQLQRYAVPINDTLYNFANFHIFYSELVTHGGLARWFPYQGFGIQSDYEQLIALAPSNYLLGALGWAAGVNDAMALFKWAAVLEQMAFVFGIHRLARLLFATRATHRALGIAATGTTVWYAQQWWDLRIYYLLPLVLSFLLRFLTMRQPVALWLAGLTGVAWSIGNLPYLIPVWLLVLLGIAAIAAREPRALARAVFTPSRANLAAFAAFAAAAALYVWFLGQALDYTVLHASDRDPLTGQVTADTFRKYGGRANLVVILNALLFGWPVHLPWGSWKDNSAYLGLLPLAGVAIAVARERSRPFLAVFAAALLLVWLSFGGVFAQLAYYLPGLAYFRHVGLVFGLVKVLLLIAAGFGLERVWRRPPPRLGGPIAAMVAVIFAVELAAGALALSSLTPKAWVLLWGVHFAIRLALYATAIALCRRRAPQALGWALAATLALDLATYQLAVLDGVPRLRGPDRALLAATRAREPVFEPERRDLPEDAAAALAAIDDEARRVAFAFATRRESREVYAYAYQFANVDPCRSHLRLDTRQVAVDRLLALERAGVAVGPAVACEAPKLRLAATATTVASDLEAERLLALALRAGDPAPAIVQLAPGEDAPAASAADGAPAGSVRLSRFTLGEVELDVDVAAPGGAWLLYADAWHPDWRASVNGESAAVRPANVAFKAVRVPGGRSAVRFWLDRGRGGVAIAGVGLAFALAWLGSVVAVASGRAAPRAIAPETRGSPPAAP
jgi:hypothetical protein